MPVPAHIADILAARTDALQVCATMWPVCPRKRCGETALSPPKLETCGLVNRAKSLPISSRARSLPASSVIREYIVEHYTVGHGDDAQKRRRSRCPGARPRSDDYARPRSSRSGSCQIGHGRRRSQGAPQNLRDVSTCLLGRVLASPIALDNGRLERLPAQLRYPQPYLPGLGLRGAPARVSQRRSLRSKRCGIVERFFSLSAVRPTMLWPRS